MKKIFSIILLFLSFSVSAQIEKIINTPPNPPRLVNDFAGVMTSAQIEALETKLVNYDRSTSSQIAVVVVSSLEGMSIEDASTNLLRKWGVGGKQDNGVVILVSVQDKKIRIETGYGMEGAVPDVTAKSIIDNSIKPSFKSNNYYRGFDLAIDDIIRAAEGRYKAPPGYGKDRKAGKGIGGLALLIIIIIIISIVSSKGGGRGGGGMVSRRGYRDFGAGWILGSLLGGGGGGWSGGGAGGWSGGGGGGFGGFGGGGGGGGGASGSW